MNVDPLYGERIRDRREECGLSQLDLSVLLEDRGITMGVNSVSKMEMGTRGLDLTEAVTICAVLNLSLLTLVARHDPGPPLVWERPLPSERSESTMAQRIQQRMDELGIGPSELERRSGVSRASLFRIMSGVHSSARRTTLTRLGVALWDDGSVLVPDDSQQLVSTEG